jgi:hypothetical protein
MQIRVISMNDLRSFRPIPTTYAGLQFRSRLEAETALLLDTFGLRWDYEPISFLMKHGIHYRPDFRLIGGRAWLEARGYDSVLGREQIVGFRDMVKCGAVKGDFILVGPKIASVTQRHEPDSVASLQRCRDCSRWSFAGHPGRVCWWCGEDHLPVELLDISVVSGRIHLVGRTGISVPLSRVLLGKRACRQP